MGRGAGTRREGRAEGSQRASGRRGPHGRSPEALTGLADQLLSFERALARRDGTAIPGGLAGLIDDDFEEFGESGRRWDRAAALALLDDAPTADVTIESCTVAPLGEHVVLVTFRSVASAPGFSARRAWRSSVWVRREGRWRLRFHQGTPAVTGESRGE